MTDSIANRSKKKAETTQKPIFEPFSEAALPILSLKCLMKLALIGFVLQSCEGAISVHNVLS
jgi:hypothetical protein